MPITCPRCDYINPDSLQYCDACGFELVPDGESVFDNSKNPNVDMDSTSELNITTELKLWITLGQFLHKSIFSFYFDEDNIDEMIHKMEFMRELDISNSGLKDLPDCLTLLKHLETLNASRNIFATFPEVIRTLPNLRKLDLSFNEITSIPLWVFELSEIRGLNLMNNKLTTLSENIDMLGSLESLSLSGNSLSVLPATITLLPNLVELDACRNKLRALPVGFERMTQMVSLILDSNDINSIPPEINDWPHLEYFSIDKNPVFKKGLPKELKTKANSSRKEFIFYSIYSFLILLFGIFLLMMFFKFLDNLTF